MRKPSLNVWFRIKVRLKRRLLDLYQNVLFPLVEYSKPGLNKTVKNWRSYGARIGKNAHIDPTCYLDRGFAHLLEIGEDAVIAMHTAFILHDSSINNVTGGRLKVGRIIIGKNAYLGAYVIVLPGVRIGDGAIIGAGSLVNTDLPAGMVAIGRPAKPVISVEELNNKFENRYLEQSDMEFYLSFPSQKEKAKLLPEEMYKCVEENHIKISEWLKGKTNSSCE